MNQTLRDILDLARWAPSGDNTQVWRFEVLGPDHVAVHFHDTREDTVYDFRGRPSQISHGTLLETMAIAATAHGLRAEITRRPDDQDHLPVFDVRFVPDPAVKPSPLLGAITTRSVQRRAMSWCSVTCTVIGGRSNTCRRSIPTSGAPARFAPQPVHGPGSCRQRAFGSATSANVDPGCPGCPPGLRPLRMRSDFGPGLANGESDDGGRDEFRLFCPSCRLKSATSASSCSIRSACPTTSSASSSYDGRRAADTPR